MEPTRLGGIKLHQGGSHLTSCCPRQDSALFNICRCIAADRVNISLLTHTADTGTGFALTTLCLKGEDTSPYYFLVKAIEGRRGTLRLQSDMDILSVFPHNQNPAVTGTLLSLLHEEDVPVYGLASSPSAMSVVIDARDTTNVVQALFGHFHFPTYRSPLQWHAAYQHQEDVFREIICSYEEKVIKTYGLSRYPDLELYVLSLAPYHVASLGAALKVMGESGVHMPFLVAQPARDGQLTVTMGVDAQHHPMALETLSQHVPQAPILRQSPTAVIMLHGPHFGDRHGIASALLGSFFRARLTPLALSCAVSSMSIAVHGHELEAHIHALNNSFFIPSSGI